MLRRIVTRQPRLLLHERLPQNAISECIAVAKPGNCEKRRLALRRQRSLKRRNANANCGSTRLGSATSFNSTYTTHAFLPSSWRTSSRLRKSLTTSYDFFEPTTHNTVLPSSSSFVSRTLIFLPHFFLFDFFVIVAVVSK